MSEHDPSVADPFGQIADEFVEAFRQGKRPSVEEFARRYPGHADEIREILPALALMEKAKSADDSPAPQAPAAAPPAVQQLGDYQILREVGRGGMGIVYEARQISLGRHVAIKVLPSHALLDHRHLRRFQREARSAARLHHTNIVPVFGVGEQGGLHYYVMQFIKGLGLDVVLDELQRLRKPGAKSAKTSCETPGVGTQASPDVSAAAVARGLMSGEFRKSGAVGDVTITPLADPGLAAPSVSGRSSDASSAIHLPGQSDGSALSESGHQYWQSTARVGMQVADALSYAASQGVLHRDIKPSNLLLDDTGNVWVTDFGLAKAASDGDDLTHTGDIVGTMRYMAPERFNGQGDLRSDTYSLGLTLYELLALKPAFDEADRHKLVKAVMHGEPVRPRKVNPAVPRDLETIVLKAIARDPAHRYQTPADLAEDLKRFVEDRPIKARPVSEGEKFLRWCRRNPLPASLLAGIVLVFLTGFAGVFSQLRVAEAARADEKLQRDRAEGLRHTAESARDEANQTRVAAARQAAGLLLDRGIEDARGGEPARALHLFVQALKTLPADDPVAAPLERVIRANLSAWAETVPALEHIWPDACHYADVAYSADGEMIALAVSSDEVQCYRTDSGRPVGPRFKIPLGLGMVSPMAFAPDARSLWVSSTSRDLVAKQWGLHRFDPTTGRSIQPPIPSDGPVMQFVTTPDGQYLVGAVWGLHPENGSGIADSSRTQRWRTESIVAWDATTGRVARKVPVNAERDLGTANASPDTYMSLSPDGNAVTAWVQRGANRFEGMTFTVAGNEPPVRVALPAVESDDRWNLNFQNYMRTGLAIKDDKLHRWSATESGVLGPGVPSPFRGMLRSPSADGRSVISQDEGRVFDTGTWPPRPSGVRFAHPGWTKNSLTPSPDGRFTATWEPNFAGGNRDGRLWRLPRPHSRPAIPPTELARQPERRLDFQFANFDPRGTTAVLWAFYRGGEGWSERASNQSKDVRIVDATTGAVREMSLRHSALVRDVVFSPDGGHFATASFDGTARVWEAATGRPAGPVLRHTNYVATVAFSPDGTTLAAGDYGPAGLVKLWDWRTGTEARPPLRFDDIVLNVSFSPDGRYLAAIKHYDWTKHAELLVWDVASGTVVFRVDYVCPAYVIRESTRFRPDGKAFAARDTNGILRLWEMHSGKRLGERALDGDGVSRFSPDGRVIAAAANLGVRLLDGGTLAPLPGGFLPRPDPITDVAFSPDGAFLLVGYTSGAAQLWDVATRKPVGPPAVLLGAIRAVTFTPDGKTCVCVAGDGTCRRWPVPVPFAEPDLDRLADRVALMTGQQLDGNQGLDSVAADKWRALRAKLVGDGSTALTPPRPDADWHDARAADAEQDRDAFGAEWHLDRLAARRPNDWTIPARRGRALAAAGRMDEAAAAYELAARRAGSPRALADWLRAAAAEDEVAKRYTLGMWNLDRAVQITPDDWVPYAARAALADKAGHAARAGADVDAAIRLGAEATVIVEAAERIVPRAVQPADWARVVSLLTAAANDPSLMMDNRYHLAVACLKAGDRAGYKAACAAIAAKMPPAETPLSSGDALAATRAYAIGPGAADDWSVPLAWADRILARIAEREAVQPSVKELNKSIRHRFLRARAALLFRAGRFEESARVLRDGMGMHAKGGESDDWALLALIEHRLGHADGAQKAAAKARAAPKLDTAWDQAEAELLASELAAALPPPGP